MFICFCVKGVIISLYLLMNLLRVYLKVYFLVLLFLFCCSLKAVPSVISILPHFMQKSSAEVFLEQKEPPQSWHNFIFFLFVKSIGFFFSVGL